MVRARSITSLLGVTIVALGCGKTTRDPLRDHCDDCAASSAAAAAGVTTAGSTSAIAGTSGIGDAGSTGDTSGTGGTGGTRPSTEPGEPGTDGGGAATGEAGAGGESVASLPDAVIVNVTLAADGASAAPEVSNDGRFIVFRSEASNLAEGAPQGGVLVADMALARTWSVRARDAVNDNSPMPYRPRISGNGRFVFFRTNQPLVDDSDRVEDLYRARRDGSQLLLASSAGLEGQFGFSEQAVSDDGRFFLFQEMPVVNDQSARRAFVRDLGSAEPARQLAPGTADDYFSSVWRPAVSGDGHRIAFDSREATLTGNAGQLHVFLQDLPNGAPRLVSVNSAGVAGDGESYAAALSHDGSVVAFQSKATNLVGADHNQVTDIFVRDLSTFTTTRVSVASDGTESNNYSNQPALSADGRYVAFLSYASNLTAFDPNHGLDVFVHDRATHVTRRVSVNEDGIGGAGDTCIPHATLNCATPSLSADGSIVVFESDAGDLVAGSVPGQRDIYWVRWQELPNPTP